MKTPIHVDMLDHVLDAIDTTMDGLSDHWLIVIFAAELALAVTWWVRR